MLGKCAGLLATTVNKTSSNRVTRVSHVHDLTFLLGKGAHPGVRFVFKMV